MAHRVGDPCLCRGDVLRSHGEKLSLCLLAPLQALYGVVLLAGVWMHAVVDHAASKPMRW
ncbi:MAG: hypothetical protein R3D68_07140 [Hyphomicrobiaceae bacterium]